MRFFGIRAGPFFVFPDASKLMPFLPKENQP